MIYLPLILFGIAALGGLTMVSIIARGKNIPLVLALAHGLFAAAGLVTLILNVAMDMSIMLKNVAMILFIVVALGGFIIFSFYLRKKPLPYWLIAVHASAAVISFILLLVAVLK